MPLQRFDERETNLKWNHRSYVRPQWVRTPWVIVILAVGKSWICDDEGEVPPQIEGTNLLPPRSQEGAEVLLSPSDVF